MRLRELAALVAKEARELLASRSYWLLLLLIGPLVGHSFLSAVELYAEASGLGGGAAALPQGLSPLDGMLVPTFGSYDLALTLLFPFVAIRLVAAEKESGALVLMLQTPFPPWLMIAVKTVVLMAGWAVAWVAGILAIVIWTAAGGHVATAETLNLLFGYLLRALLATGVALAAAAMARSASSAAIVTLAFTVGTWALDFTAAGRGGTWQLVAATTPAALLRFFEQGLLSLRVVLDCLIVAAAGLSCAATWLPTGTHWRRRAILTTTIGTAACAGLWSAQFVRAAWDCSENRRNSFPPAQETALRTIRQPLQVTVYLSAEDPRLMDFERNVLSKLRRTVGTLEVIYGARSRSGLFETAAEHYGEIHYELNGRKAVSRSVMEPIVLETIFQLAGIPPPVESKEFTYSGHPLQAKPGPSAWLFFGLWPLAVLAAFALHSRDKTRDKKMI